MKHLFLLPAVALISACGFFSKPEPVTTPDSSNIPAWDGAHILCSENVSFAQDATEALPEFTPDDRLGFCTRSMKYLALHRQYGDQTTYFAIAAATTGSLAATYARLVRRAYSGPTWEFMQSINLALDANVDAAVAKLEAGAAGGAQFTNRLIESEQANVQNMLNAHQTSDLEGYANVISDVGNTLNPTNPMLLAAINRNPFFAAYEASLAEIRAETGGDVNFSLLSHRLKISAALDQLINNIAPYPVISE